MMTDDPHLYLGAVLDQRYELRRHVATGGMAHVFQAYDHNLDRDVAIKIPLARLANQADFLASFTEEAKAAAKLSHPHVVAIYDQKRTEYPPALHQLLKEQGDPDQPLVYLVMEYVNGATLRQVLRPGQPMPVAEALKIFAGLASAVAASHEQNLLHRDIKPENVLLTDTQVKVTDFGLAHAIDQPSHQGTSPSSKDSDAAVIYATAAYAAPEQLQHGQVSTRTDVYAAGVVLYEMLTGSLPHTATGEPEHGSAHLSVPKPSSMVPTLAPAIDALVVGATAANPQQRIPDGPHLLQAVHAAEQAVHHAPSDAATTVSMPPITDAQDHPGKPHHTMDLPVVPGPALAGDPAATGGWHSARRRGWAAWGLVAAITAVALLIVGVIVANVYGPLATTTTPALVGKTRAQAEQSTLNDGLHPDFQQEFSETVAADQVIRTEPVAGSTIDKNGTLTIVISAGKERYEVPDLRGMTLTQAGQALQQRNLVLGSNEATYTADYPEGQIVDSSPNQGRSLKRGSKVDVTLSRGPGVVVPPLTSRPAQEALQQLQQSGLVLGEQKYENSATVPNGSIIDSSPKAGERVAAGSTVTLTISQGPKLIPVPDVTTWDYHQAEKELQSKGFKVEVNGLKLANKVLWTQPGAGTQLPEGSTVTLAVS